jgi:hypothetical protein
MLSNTVSEIFRKYRSESPDIRWPGSLRLKLRDFVDESFPGDDAYSLYSCIDTFLFEEIPIVTDLGYLKASDKIYLQQICSMRRYIARSGSLCAADDQPIFSTKEEDFLHDDDANWSLLKALNFALLLSIRPTKEVAIVTSMRNEGLGILEWIAHHRAMGFFDYYIYTNNNSDESLDLLRTLQGYGIINLIENEVGENVGIQKKFSSIQFTYYLHCALIAGRSISTLMSFLSQKLSLGWTSIAFYQRWMHTLSENHRPRFA